jgi:histidinol-phosphate aminotransferase
MSWKDYVRPAVFDLGLYRPFEQRPGLVRLDANESALPLDPEEREACLRALAVLDVRRYPEVSGRPLREALARRWGFSPEEILVGNGSDEVITILAAAFGESKARGRGKVLVPSPTFGEYESIARSHGLSVVEVPLDSEWNLDEARLAEAIDRERPALAFFASPNNPTANRFDEAVLDRLAERFDGCFVVDEAYADFSGGSAHLNKVRRRESFCVMKTLSKIGMAGLRLGALVGPRDLIAELDKVRLPYNVDAVAMALACAILADPSRLDARIERVAELRAKLEADLRAIPGLTVYRSDANFVLIRTSIDAQKVFERLLERRIVVRNPSRPGPLENCLRITAGTQEENEQCLKALRAALA